MERVERRFVCANVQANNNKFWYIIVDGSRIVTLWGRVGDPPQSKDYGCFGNHTAAVSQMQKMIKAKTRVHTNKASYREVDFIPDGKVEVRSNGNIAEIAKKQIQHSCPEVARLIDYLIQVNIHQITSTTNITFNDSTGLFKTPLGIVGKATVLDARKRLERIGDALLLREKDGQGLPLAEYTALVEDYLMLIPQNVGRKRLNLKALFPDLAKVQEQSAILDALEASIEAVKVPAEPKKTENVELPKVFEVKLEVLSDQKVFDWISKYYFETHQRRHESSKFKPAKVYTVYIPSMSERFENGGAKRVGNVCRYWHGTRSSNLLSILKGGLVIPPKSASHVTARMYGDGVYFSDQSTKSLNYAYGTWGNQTRDDNPFMFLADVAMGKPYTPRSSTDRRNLPKAGYDSTFAKAGVSGVYNNEMVVYNLDQINLVYLVEFSK